MEIIRMEISGEKHGKIGTNFLFFPLKSADKQKVVILTDIYCKTQSLG